MLPLALAVGSLFATGAAATALALGSMVAGIYTAREQRRKAERAMRRSIKDRTVMVREATTDRPHVFGRVRLSGQVQFPGSFGQYNEYLAFALAVGDRFDAIEDVWFNDASMGPVNGLGFADTGSPYYRERTEVGSVTQTVSASRTITVPYTVTGHSLSIMSVVIPPPTYTHDPAVPAVPYYPGDDGIPIFNYVPPAGSPDEGQPIGTLLTAGSPDDSVYQYSVDVGETQTVFTFHPALIGAHLTLNFGYLARTRGARIMPFLGAPGQVAEPLFTALLPSVWTANDRFTDTSGTCGYFVYDPDFYPSGIPEISVVARAELCYDPRTGTTVWTRNPALIARRYIIKHYPSAAFNDASVIAAANACDETVSVDGSTTQARYTFDDVISSDTAPKEGLERILQAMVGSAVESGGEWFMWAGVYESPTIALDESDISEGEIVIQSDSEAGELFNGVSGKYLDPTKWVEDSFPAYISPTYAAMDGGDEEVLDLDLTQITDIHRVQRVAKLLLFKARQSLTFAVICGMSAYEVTPGDMVTWTLPRYGWAEKEFRCLDRVYDPHGFIVFLFQEDAEAIYAWDYSEATNPDPSPNTQLPDPRFVAPLVMSFDSGQEFVSRLPDGKSAPFVRAYWEQPAAQVEQIRLWWRRDYETIWRKFAIDDPNQRHFDIYDIAAQERIIVRACAVNGMGRTSEPSVHEVDVDTTAPPNTSASSSISVGTNYLRNAQFDGLYSPVNPYPWVRGDLAEPEPATETQGFLGWGAAGTFYDAYRPDPMNSLVAWDLASGPMSGTHVFSIGGGIGGLPVSPGMRIEMSVFAAQQASSVSFALLLRNGNREMIAAPGGGYFHPIAQTDTAALLETETQYTGMSYIGAYKRIHAFYEVPEGVSSAGFAVVVWRRTTSGRSFAILTMPYFGYAYRGQVDPSPWRPGL